MYRTWAPLGWEAAYDPQRFWHLVYATAPTDVASAVLLSQSRGAGWIYVTGDMLPNPWDTLPADPYWSIELAFERPLAGCTAPAIKPKLTVRNVAAPAGDDRVAFALLLDASDPTGRARAPSTTAWCRRAA